jgi:hypothetical protein
MAKEKKVNSTAIKSCNCKNDYQDKHYGSGRRVHNFAEAKKGWRCTVCSLVKGV